MSVEGQQDETAGPSESDFGDALVEPLDESGVLEGTGPSRVTVQSPATTTKAPPEEPAPASRAATPGPAGAPAGAGPPGVVGKRTLNEKTRQKIGMLLEQSLDGSKDIVVARLHPAGAAARHGGVLPGDIVAFIDDPARGKLSCRNATLDQVRGPARRARQAWRSIPRARPAC